MFKVDRISFTDSGTKITYDYSHSPEVAVFLNKKQQFFAEYDLDVSSVPASIAIIPLLANIAPIAWFAGFDIEAGDVDADFIAALAKIKAELQIHYPELASKKSNLICNPVANTVAAGKSAMLFSGGVDAFATFFRHYSETPALITIQGADIDLTDDTQWNNVVRFNENESMLEPNQKHYIKANLRTFYTYQVDLLLQNLSWWGNIQHGLALIGVCAPLSYLKEFQLLYIASTRSATMEFNPWGSMPETDEKISWAGIKVIHDGFELKRQDKVDLIVDAVTKLQKNTTIRVCYSELKDGLNCSQCEKCIRTIFGIVLAGGDPKNFGFSADADLYKRIDLILEKGFKSKGTQFFWYELFEKGQNNDRFFVFSDFDKEKQQIDRILQKIERDAGNDLVRPSALKKIKHVLIHKYPGVFKIYMKLRRAI